MLYSGETMRTTLVIAIAATVLVGGAYLVRNSVCRGGSATPAAAAGQAGGARGSVLGAYDPAMAMCSFSCAAKVAYREADLHAQPGVRDGQLARCPVSGVVFRADARRPRVHLATGEYVTCCGNCAAKLEKSPGRFIHL